MTTTTPAAPAPPAGFTIRPAVRVSPDTIRRRPLEHFAGDLRPLVAAGGAERWLTPREAGFGSAAGVVSGLESRGAILVAERGRRRVYLVTARGLEVAR